MITPTYFRAMVDSLLGWVLLIVLATTVFVGYGLAEVAISLFGRARAVPGMVALIGLAMTWLVGVSLALLGPAALILMKPT